MNSQINRQQDTLDLLPELSIEEGTTNRHAIVMPLKSQALLRGLKTVTIEHNGELYRLQNTRAGKLILTK